MEFIELAEQLLHQVALVAKVILEFLAVLITLIASINALKLLLTANRKISKAKLTADLRLDLARSLALSLEFLLGADIVGTAVSPDWNALGQLAAVAVIRTFLNYFLAKEVKELQTEHLPES
ncbi:DUF1622 domain-containing protein [Synechocystis sp. LKSZ1]|uniref:DUF1622 domain-containing protein n=1 Tax=Synechocystis sp. LKSZ1 TaxID=3144951 RepID=UPI00336C1119